jgi:hypothetical protein
MIRTFLVGAVLLCLLPMFAAPTASATTKQPSVVILSTDASPQRLGPAGGTTTVQAFFRHATTCRLKLISGQSFPVVYATNFRACSTTLKTYVTVGGNPSPIARTVEVALVARNKSSVSTRFFKIILNVPPPPTTTTVLPAAPTTTPPARPGGTVKRTEDNG